MRKPAALAAALLFTFCHGPLALAQGAGEADAHFKRGVELYKESDFNAALIEFRRAYELDPRFQALYNIGETYYQLQDYANALRTLEKYMRDGGAQVSPARREEVTRDIDKLRTRVASVEVTTNVPDVEITVDDVPAGKTPLSQPILVSAGRRKLVFTKAGKPPVTQLVEVAGGDLRKLSISIAEDPKGPAGPAVPEQPVSKPVPVAPWVVTGILGAGAIATGALALVASNDLKSKLSVFPKANPDDISSAHTKTFALALTTDILIGTAVVMGGVSIYLTATAGSRGDKPAARWESPFAAPHAEQAGVVTLHAGPKGVVLTGSF